MDWTTVAKASQEAFREGVNDWIGKARIQGGQVNGSTALLTPGSLTSGGNVEVQVLQKLLSARVHPDIARALAKELAAAWNHWALTFTLTIPAAYPSFAAYPGPMAPPLPAATGPIPLTRGLSAGEVSLNAAVLSNQLGLALKPHLGKATGVPDQALKRLADWVESSFKEWRGLAMLIGLMGKGPVPTFAPPYVPVGPVVAGDNFGAMLVGPRFGKVVI